MNRETNLGYYHFDGLTLVVSEQNHLVMEPMLISSRWDRVF